MHRDGMHREGQEGFILALVLVILSILTIFGVAMMLLSTINVETAGNVRADQNALNIAYSRFERGQQYIIDRECYFNTTGSTNLLDSYDLTGTKPVTCENVTATHSESLKDQLGRGKLEIRAYFRKPSGNNCEPVQRPHFLLTSSGELTGVTKTIEARIEQVSFLNFTRFVQQGDLEINLFNDVDREISGNFYTSQELKPVVRGAGPAKAILSGDVYVGHTSLTSPGNVEVLGKTYVTYEKQLSLDISDQVEYLYSEASSCGWVINAANRSVLEDSIDCCNYKDHPHNPDCSTSSGACNDLLDLEHFDYSTNPPTYTTPDGTAHLPSNFNGVVVWDSTGMASDKDLHVRGDYSAAKSVDALDTNNEPTIGKDVTIVNKHTEIYIDNNIGKSNYHYVGLVVSGGGKNVKISHYAPLWLRTEAAILAADGALVKDDGGMAECTGPSDTDCEPQVTDNLTRVSSIYKPNTSQNLDNENGIDTTANTWGWDEDNLNENRTLLFHHTGPLITKIPPEKEIYEWHSPDDKNNNTNLQPLHWVIESEGQIGPPTRMVFPRVRNLLKLISYKEELGTD